MYKVFNMGNRMEFYCEEGVESDIIDIARSFNIDAQVIGYVEDSEEAKVTVKSPNGTFSYNK
jgi:phosphoribosylformylglycinamidine cyclo-ligase